MDIPRDIANTILNFDVTIDEAAELIRSYAEAYAAGEVVKAMEQQHARNMAILEAPLTKVPS